MKRPTTTVAHACCQLSTWRWGRRVGGENGEDMEDNGVPPTEHDGQRRGANPPLAPQTNTTLATLAALRWRGPVVRGESRREAREGRRDNRHLETRVGVKSNGRSETGDPKSGGRIAPKASPTSEPKARIWNRRRRRDSCARQPMLTIRFHCCFSGASCGNAARADGIADAAATHGVADAGPPQSMEPISAEIGRTPPKLGQI